MIVYHSGLIHIYPFLYSILQSGMFTLFDGRAEWNGKKFNSLQMHLVNPGLHTLCRILFSDTVQFFRRPTKNEQKQLASSMQDSCVDDPSLFWLHYKI